MELKEYIIYINTKDESLPGNRLLTKTIATKLCEVLNKWSQQAKLPLTYEVIHLNPEVVKHFVTE